MAIFNSIRQFREEDFTAVSEIYSQSKLDELRFEEQSFILLPIESDKERLAALMESDIYVFGEDNIAGYLAIHCMEIRALFVHPDSRGKGIGKQLLEYALALVKGKAILYVAKNNTPAKALYRSYGFSVVEEFETEYNGVPILANKMARYIPG